MNRRESLMMLGGTTLMAAGWTTVAQAQESSADITDSSAVVEMTLGDENAPVTLIEYASFTCPHCARFHQNQFKELKTEFIDTGKVRFIYRDVYFDKFALWASMVARCGGPERFFGIVDMIYDQQKEWIGDGSEAGVAERLRRIGKVAGLSEQEVDACLSDRAHAEALVAVYQENAAADNIRSTPTLLIDGIKHDNLTYPELKALIEENLE